MLLLICQKTNRKYYVKKTDENFSTKDGLILKEDLLSDKAIIKAKNGLTFLKLMANSFDKHSKIKRSAQIITPKDIGYILVRSGIDKTSKVLEAGSGSASLTIFLSKFCSSVKTYEIKKEHYLISKKNIENLSLENVEIVNDDIFENIENEKDYDFIFLDLISPERIFDYGLKNTIKRGQYICFYLTSIFSLISLKKKLENFEDDFLIDEICEINKREWHYKKLSLRPQTKKEIDFTSFLVFVRRV